MQPPFDTPLGANMQKVTVMKTQGENAEARKMAAATEPVNITVGEPSAPHHQLQEPQSAANAVAYSPQSAVTWRAPIAHMNSGRMVKPFLQQFLGTPSLLLFLFIWFDIGGAEADEAPFSMDPPPSDTTVATIIVVGSAAALAAVGLYKYCVRPTDGTGAVQQHNSDNCYYAVRHHDDALPPQLEALMDKWGTRDTERGHKAVHHDCRGFFDGCQTFSCLDAKGVQIFVVNSCAAEAGKCTHADLDPICGAEGGTVNKCEICRQGLCNEAKIELLQGTAQDGTDNRTEKDGDGTDAGGGAKTEEIVVDDLSSSSSIEK